MARQRQFLEQVFDGGFGDLGTVKLRIFGASNSELKGDLDPSIPTGRLEVDSFMPQPLDSSDVSGDLQDCSNFEKKNGRK